MKKRNDKIFYNHKSKKLIFKIFFLEYFLNVKINASFNCLQSLHTSHKIAPIFHLTRGFSD